MTRLVCMSDTHGRHHEVTHIPDADILIHCGDITRTGAVAEANEFMIWFSRIPIKQKAVIAGNHDRCMEQYPHLVPIPDGVSYLNDSGVEFDGIFVWGSPVSPSFGNWFFNRERGAQIKEHWDKIPMATDILVTHGPPKGILDETLQMDHPGCKDLLDAIEFIQPSVHCFGHIHKSYGHYLLKHNSGMETMELNCALTGEDYNLTRKPIVYDL